MKVKKRAWWFLPFLLIILVVFLGVTASSNYGVWKILDNSIHQTLSEVSQQQAFQVHKELKSDIGALNNISVLLDAGSEADMAQQLTNLQPNTGFYSLAYADEQGNMVNQNGETQNISQNDTYINAMQGQVVIGNATDLSYEAGQVIPVAVPMRDEPGDIRGVLMGMYSSKELKGMVAAPFGGDGQVFLINSTGRLLTSSEKYVSGEQKQSDTEGEFQTLSFISGSNEAQLISDMEQEKAGHTVFKLNGGKWHCHYNPVGFGGLYVFTIVNHDVGMANAFAISQQFFFSSILLLLCFILCFGYILRQSKKHTAALERIAYWDKLCDCQNLSGFRLTAQQYIDSHPGEPVLMVKLDVEEFKLINHIYGWRTGDFVLICIADILRQLTESDCFARSHDDEFFVMLRCGTEKNLADIRQRFLDLLRERIRRECAYELRIVAGHYYMSFENCRDIGEAIEKANTAHRKAKELGTEICVYDAEFVRQALWGKRVERRLESGIIDHEFKVYLQAQYTLSDDTVRSAEALVRWEWEGRLLSPAEFVPILEENGLITKVDLYVWEEVCKNMREWTDAGLEPIEISVNFSRKHLINPDFVKDLCRIADKYQVPHGHLAVELTETAIIENEKVLLQITERLHEEGFLVSMDDFGTGYSSLGAFKNMLVDILKIDRSFFVDELYRNRAKVLISSVIKMAAKLGITSIAEGVEEQDHIDFLREVGCDKVQSYYFERPVPIETFRTRKTVYQRPGSRICTDVIRRISEDAAGDDKLKTNRA